MAFTRLAVLSLCKQYSKLLVSDTCGSLKAVKQNVILQHNSFVFPTSNIWRYSHTFLSRVTADQLWKGVTTVSPAGRRKGRGKVRKVARDLNRGQILGCGKKNMLWPGLNSPVIQGREVIKQQELPPNEEREKRILELRDKFGKRRAHKLHPLERGWCGDKLPGRSLGPPDPIGDDTFEGFDSRVLEFKTVMHLSGSRGKIRNYSAFVVVGNKKGLAGFALAKSVNGTTAANAAKNRAAKVLRYIERENNTVIHDFCAEFGAVKIFVEKRPEGFGLVCHRVLRAICEVLGIKDMYAKVEGTTKNYQCIAKAFFIGLMTQKSYQQIANEKGLHVVELKEEKSNFPVVVASPEKCRTEEEIEPTELLDFSVHLHNGKVVKERKKFQPFYINFPSYIKEMKDRERLRNQRGVQIHLCAKYGAMKSFLHVREEEKLKQQLKNTVEEGQ